MEHASKKFAIRGRAHAPLMLAVLLLSISLASSKSLETSSTLEELDGGVVFVAGDSEISWTGDCPVTPSCTQAAPCRLPQSVAVDPASSSCTVVFAAGIYENHTSITSSSPLSLGFSGAVSNLYLSLTAPSVQYTSFPSDSNSSKLIGGIQEILLSNSSVSLELANMAFEETQFTATSSLPITGTFSITIVGSSLSLQVNDSGLSDSPSDSPSIFSVNVPVNASTGLGTFIMKNSKVTLNQDALTNSLLTSQLRFSTLAISQGSEIDSALYVFNVPSTGLKEVTIEQSSVKNFLTLVSDPLPWETAPYADAKMKIDSSTINGTMNHNRDFAALNPSTCMDLTVSNATLAQLRMNCNDYSKQTTYVRCPARYTNALILDSFFCVFGSPGSSDVAPTVFSNTTVKITAKALGNPIQAPPMAWFKGPLEIESSGGLTLKNEMIVSRPNQPPFLSNPAGEFRLEGNITILGNGSLTANYLSFSDAKLVVSRLNLLESALLTSSTSGGPRSLLMGNNDPSGDVQYANYWNFATPVAATGVGGTWGLKIDFTTINFLNVVASRYVEMAYPAIDSRQGAELYAGDARTFIKKTHIEWDSSVIGYDPQGEPGSGGANYNIGNFKLPEGATTITQTMPSLPGDRWNFSATTELFSDEHNVFNIWFGLSSSFSPSAAPMFRPVSGQCSPKPPYPGDFWCFSGEWTSREPLNVTGNFWIPQASKTVIRGDLNVTKDIVFQDWSSKVTLEKGGCLTSPRSKSKPNVPITKFIFEISADQKIPAHLGTRQKPDWEVDVFEQSDYDCPYIMSNVDLVVRDSRPSCMKVRGSLSKSSSVAILKLKLHADYTICNDTIIIVTCTVGAVFFVLIAAFAVFCCCRSNKRSGYEQLYSPVKPVNDGGMITADESSSLL